MMKARSLLILAALSSGLALACLPWRAAAQAPMPPPVGSAGSVAGPGEAQWSLSDLVDGLIRLQNTSLPLSPAQREKIRPALERVVLAARLMTATETRLRQTLTPEQIGYIESLQRNGTLLSSVSLEGPQKPGQDPLVTRVLQILEERSR